MKSKPCGGNGSAGKKSAACVRAVLDRIEEKQWAVFVIEGGGRVVLPVKLFNRSLREGQVFNVEWCADPSAEKKLRNEVRDLQQALTKRTKGKGGRCQ